MVDCWAFACTFYEVLHIKPMFPGPEYRLPKKIENIELQEFEAKCPKEFKSIIMECFEANPGNRPSALELTETIENVRFNLQRVSKTESARRPLATKMRFEKLLILMLTCFKLEEDPRLWQANLAQFN